MAHEDIDDTFAVKNHFGAVMVGLAAVGGTFLAMGLMGRAHEQCMACLEKKIEHNHEHFKLLDRKVDADHEEFEAYKAEHAQVHARHAEEHARIDDKLEDLEHRYDQLNSFVVKHVADMTKRYAIGPTRKSSREVSAALDRALRMPTVQ